MIQAAEQLAESMSVSAAYQALGVPRSSLYRARQPKKARQPRPTPGGRSAAGTRSAGLCRSSDPGVHR